MGVPQHTVTVSSFISLTTTTHNLNMPTLTPSHMNTTPTPTLASSAPNTLTTNGTPTSPDGWLHDATPQAKTEDEAEEERLLQEALLVLEEAEANGMDKTSMVDASTAPAVTMTAPAPAPAPVSAPIHEPSKETSTPKRSREVYEIDLENLKTKQAAVMQLEHSLYKARYDLQTTATEFQAKHYTQEVMAALPTTQTVKRRKKAKKIAIPLAAPSADGDATVDGMSTKKTMTRGWNNYVTFGKLCKTFHSGSHAIRRSFTSAIWDLQKQSLETFFARNHVSPSACKAMADMDAYRTHITTTVRAAMEADMPFCVEMIRLYDAHATEAENLTRLSSMCALPWMAKAWSTDHVVPSQTLLMSVWDAFQGMWDLECTTAGIPAMFPETIPEGSTTQLMTEARLKHEVAPKMATTMPYLVTVFQSFQPSMTVAEEHTLVQQANMAYSGNADQSPNDTQTSAPAPSTL